MSRELSRRQFLTTIPVLLLPHGGSPPVGASPLVGPLGKPKIVNRLVITRPGIYENYLVDCEWQGGNRVKIQADDVTLRNCEIRNATGNGIAVLGKNVLIENCHIHHLLAGSFERQVDAHGVTGGWYNVTIRNCNIHHISGDCIQFDPDRVSVGRVVVENCTLWTGPLKELAAEFLPGQRPGENAVDTKTPPPGHPPRRCELIIRRCLCYGWNQPAQISNCAALNIKEHVRATIEESVFYDNEICFRLRGPGPRGGARVTIRRCAVYYSKVAVRMEDDIRNLRIHELYVGDGIQRLIHRAGGRKFPGFWMDRPKKAPPLEELLVRGFPA